MESTLTVGSVKNWIKNSYAVLRRKVPLMGVMVRYAWDTINLPRKSRVALDELLRHTTRIQYQLSDTTERLEKMSRSANDASLEEIKQLLSKTVFYQPLHGYIDVDPQKEPQRPCTDRADVIHQFLGSMGPTRLLDIGCSFGYFSFYMAARGYGVDAIDSDQNCVNICSFLSRYNTKNKPYIENATFDLDYIKQIPTEKYDIVLLLSVLHHITSEKGIPYVQDMMSSLLERAPMLIVELALCEEDVPFPWKDRLPANELEIFARCKDIEIVKLGCFSTHLSPIKRPLYAVLNKKLTINNRSYEVMKRRFIAHEDAHHYFRVFYETKNEFIKNYRLQHTLTPLEQSKLEMLNEIAVYQQLPSNTLFPQLIDQVIATDSIKLVLSKLPGVTLKAHLENEMSSLDAVQIVKRVIGAVKILRDKGYYHNDIRSWNVMVDREANEAYLFDLGRAAVEEHENTVIAILWLIYQLQRKKSVNYLKQGYPLTAMPKISVDSLDPELQRITKKLLSAQSIDDYFKSEAQ